MSLSRRQLLAAIGLGGAVGTAGCASLDEVRSVAGGGGSASRPSGELSSSIGDAIFAPGSLVDVDHRMFSARDLTALRENEGNDVAAGLLDLPTTKAENGFDLDPSTVEHYGRYARTELLAGSFGREVLVESFRNDDWSLAERHRGIDVFTHPEQPERYAAGVGDGILFTTGRYRTVPGPEFVRAHADAIAGELPRYGENRDMRRLLGVLGGGDYVSAITSPVELSERPPNARAIGRAIDVGSGGVTDTVAFVLDESASETPEAAAEEWGGKWASQSDGGFSSGATTGAEGRVGYFSARRATSAFTRGGSVVGRLRSSGPTVPMQRKVSERYTEDHGLEPPEASFSYEVLGDGGETACGGGSTVVAVTHAGGDPIPAGRLLVGFPQAREAYSLDRCGYAYDEEFASGETVRIGFEADGDGQFLVYWQGPHGNDSSYRANRTN